MSDVENLAEQLADYPAGLDAIADALRSAAASARLQKFDPVAISIELERRLVRRELRIDALVANAVVRCLVTLLAAKTGVGPQRVLEEHFKAAPTEETWRQLIDAARREKEGQ